VSTAELGALVEAERALERCRTALDADLRIPGYRDGLIEAARRAGATMDEIEAAFDARA
jgi:hypothetical protein